MYYANINLMLILSVLLLLPSHKIAENVLKVFHKISHLLSLPKMQNFPIYAQKCPQVAK